MDYWKDAANHIQTRFCLEGLRENLGSRIEVQRINFTDTDLLRINEAIDANSEEDLDKIRPFFIVSTENCAKKNISKLAIFNGVDKSCATSIKIFQPFQGSFEKLY